MCGNSKSIFRKLRELQQNEYYENWINEVNLVYGISEKVPAKQSYFLLRRTLCMF